MKMTIKLGVCLVWSILFLISTIESSASGTQSLTANDFSALPKINSVRISPDGKKIIYILNEGNNSLLVSYNLDTKKSVYLYRTREGKSQSDSSEKQAQVFCCHG